MQFLTRSHNTKIVATIGPASSTPAQLRELFRAGVDIFRLNFSHENAEAQRPRVDAIRELEKEFNHPVSILADLQGPKLRIGKFEGDKIDIKVGQTFTLDMNEALGDTTRVQMPHPEIFAAVHKGDSLLLDDGNVRLRIEEVTKDKIVTTVMAGYRLSNRKGVNVPGAVLNISALTPKDRIDLEGALNLGVDWIALSFVQRPEDISEAQALIHGRASLVAKIEKPAALDSLAGIMELTDAVMVARGDLGVELPPEKVPSAQKRIVRLARQKGKPVIVATQMLESMVTNATPTRAEASDVATAIFDGADAVMLSAETAMGQHPVEAVSIMARIATEVEHDDVYRRIVSDQHADVGGTTSEAITAAARLVAESIGAAAVVTFTTSGKTTLRAARERPMRPIVCLTSYQAVARRMMLVYGVRSIRTGEIGSFAEMSDRAAELVKEYGIAAVGETIVVTAGVPFAQAGSTNILHVKKIA